MLFRSELLGKIKAEKAKSNKKEKPLPPIKPEEIPFQISKNWVWCRLGEICEIVRGGSPRPAGDLTYYEGKIPFLKVGDLTSGDDVYLYTHKYTIKEAGLYKTRFVEANTLMLTNSGATLGYPKICTFPTTFNDGIAAFLNLSDEFDKVYLFYFLKSLTGWFLKEASRGQGQPNLNTDIIGLTPIPIPPLSEQNKIVDFLVDFKDNNLKSDGYYFNKEVEQKIINLHKTQLLASENFSLISHQLTLIENLNQAILQEAVQGKLLAKAALKHEKNNETGQQLLERIKAEKVKSFPLRGNKKGATLPPIKSEEIPFEIPENWVWCRLGEMSINRDGDRKPISLVERERKAKIYDYYGASGKIDKIDGYTHEGKLLLIGEDGANLVARSTPIAFLADGKFWVNNHAHVIGAVDIITLNYLCFYINSIDLKPFITGGFQPKLSQGNLNIIPVPLPPLSEQKLIVAEIERQLAKTKALKAQIVSNQTNTEALLKALLSSAFEVV